MVETEPSGAPARLEGILEQYGATLRRTIAGLGVSRLGIQIDDVEQEARIRLWKALEREKTIDLPASYLYRVAVSAAIDAIRRARARREDRSDDPGPLGEPEVSLADPAPSPERRAEAHEIATAVARASAVLSPDRRTAVLLLLQGLNSREIARLSGWSEGRARNLAYRGLADLRRALAAQGVEVEG
jgi:RNA polymerase sigma-70 factor (ECF subfamily)